MIKYKPISFFLFLITIITWNESLCQWKSDKHELEYRQKKYRAEQIRIKNAKYHPNAFIKKDKFTFEEMIKSVKLVYTKPNHYYPTLQFFRPDYNLAILKEIFDTTLVKIDDYNNSLTLKNHWRKYFGNWDSSPYKITKELLHYLKTDSLYLTFYSEGLKFPHGPMDLVIWEIKEDQLIPQLIYPGIISSSWLNFPIPEILGSDTLKIGSQTTDVDDVFGGYNYFVFSKSSIRLIKEIHIRGTDLTYLSFNVPHKAINISFTESYYDEDGNYLNRIRKKEIYDSNRVNIYGTIKITNLQTYKLDLPNQECSPWKMMNIKTDSVQIFGIYEDLGIAEIRVEENTYLIMLNDIEY